MNRFIPYAVCLVFFPTLLSYNGYAQVDSFEVVAVHSKAALQPSANGRIIATLMPWNGKLYMGYGDYGANTGPISVSSYDPATGAVAEEFIANTEAIYIYRALGGRLYAPAIDRKAGGKPGDYVALDSTGIWKEYDCTPITTHAFDMASLGGDDLWLAGSNGSNACVWRSTDRGATWSVNRQDSARSGITNDFARYYFIATFQGRLYVQARDYQGPMHPASQLFDGFGWLTGPDLFPGAGNSLGWQPTVFKNYLVYRSWQPPSYAAQFWAFDGNTARQPEALRVWDIFVDSSYIWTLAMYPDSTLAVRRSSDIDTWETVTEAPRGSRSLAVMGGTLYVGTKDSELMAYELPVPSAVQDIGKSAEPMSFRLYPNPAQDRVTMEFTGRAAKYSMRVFDTLGKVVYRSNGESDLRRVTLNIAGFIAGTYFAVVQSQSGISTGRFIVR